MERAWSGASATTSKRVRLPHAAQRYRSPMRRSVRAGPGLRTSVRSERLFVYTAPGGRRRRPTSAPRSPRSRSSSSTSRPPAAHRRATAITEIGALKLRGGELLGRFETLVNPGVPIPPFITVLTGITEAMVLPAPRDRRAAADAPRVPARRGDRRAQHPLRLRVPRRRARRNGYRRSRTGASTRSGSARRLVRDDVPNLRLHTLAQHFRTDTEPVHRAYADAAATAEVFHSLLEHAAHVRRPRARRPPRAPDDPGPPVDREARAHGAAARAPGRVPVPRPRAATSSTSARRPTSAPQVRAYFAGDDRPKVPQLLREATRIEHRVCAGPLEPRSASCRLDPSLPTALQPLAHARRPRSVYLQAHRRPRPGSASSARRDDASRLGPFLGPSAHLAREAVERRCQSRRVTTADRPDALLGAHVAAGCATLADLLRRCARAEHGALDATALRCAADDPGCGGTREPLVLRHAGRPHRGAAPDGARFATRRRRQRRRATTRATHPADGRRAAARRRAVDHARRDARVRSSLRRGRVRVGAAGRTGGRRADGSVLVDGVRRSQLAARPRA